MIDSFRGEYAFLSNFYHAPFIVKGIRVDTVEHAFQACKTLDKTEQKKILSAKTPGEAKRLGRKCTLRKDWEKVKLRAMEKLVRMKFEQSSNLAQKLINTGNELLIEGNTWGDTFWGVCQGKGQNHLGRILKTIREEMEGYYG